MAWYISNMFRELNRCNNSGLRPLANSIALSLWGISVPKMDAIARIIKIIMVSLTELKKAQIIFDFFSVLNIFMDIWVIKAIVQHFRVCKSDRLLNMDQSKLQFKIVPQKVSSKSLTILCI